MLKELPSKVANKNYKAQMKSPTSSFLKKSYDRTSALLARSGTSTYTSKVHGVTDQTEDLQRKCAVGATGAGRLGVTHTSPAMIMRDQTFASIVSRRRNEKWRYIHDMCLKVGNAIRGGGISIRMEKKRN